MTPADPRSDDALLLAIAAGESAASAVFRSRHAAVMDRVCRSVAADDRSASEALADLRAADLTTVFAGFDGRSTPTTFVVAALVQRFLFPRLLRRLGRDPLRHAAEFEAFFRHDLHRVVRSAVPRGHFDQDAAQWIWERLLDRDGAQLRKFAGEALTPGFVVVKLKRLAQDFLSSRAAPAEGRRRAMPECLAGMPAFDRDVYKQFHWWRAASAGMAVLALRHRHPDATEAAVLDARTRVEAALRVDGDPSVVDRQPESLDDRPLPTLPSGEQPDAFAEVERAAFRRALLAAAGGLTSLEKLCLLKRLQGKAAGEIADELGLSRPDAYDLTRKVVDKLRRALARHPAARERIATVTGNDAYVEIDPKAGAAPRLRPRTA